MELRPEADDVRDLPGGQFLVEPEVEQQLIARLEAVEGGLERRGAVGPVRPAFGIGRRIADGGRVELLPDQLDELPPQPRRGPDPVPVRRRFQPQPPVALPVIVDQQTVRDDDEPGAEPSGTDRREAAQSMEVVARQLVEQVGVSVHCVVVGVHEPMDGVQEERRVTLDEGLPSRLLEPGVGGGEEGGQHGREDPDLVERVSRGPGRSPEAQSGRHRTDGLST